MITFSNNGTFIIGFAFVGAVFLLIGVLVRHLEADFLVSSSSSSESEKSALAFPVLLEPINA